MFCLSRSGQGALDRGFSRTRPGFSSSLFGVAVVAGGRDTRHGQRRRYPGLQEETGGGLLRDPGLRREFVGEWRLFLEAVARVVRFRGDFEDGFR